MRAFASARGELITLPPGLASVRGDDGGGRERARRRSQRVSQVLAGEPGQGEVGDLAPSVIEDERVAAVGEGVIIGDRA